MLHVLDVNLGAVAGLPASLAAMLAYSELLDVVRRETQTGMAKVAKRYPTAQALIREGSPRDSILEVAEEVRAGLIVMGTRGRTGLTRAFFGSVAEHLVRHSRVPDYGAAIVITMPVCQ